jgi:hypothetical protein
VKNHSKEEDDFGNEYCTFPSLREKHKGLWGSGGLQAWLLTTIGNNNNNNDITGTSISVIRIFCTQSWPYSIAWIVSCVVSDLCRHSVMIQRHPQTCFVFFFCFSGSRCSGAFKQTAGMSVVWITSHVLINPASFLAVKGSHGYGHCEPTANMYQVKQVFYVPKHSASFLQSKGLMATAIASPLPTCTKWRN